MKIKAIFWQIFTIILIFGISFGIWYLVNTQLSDDLTVEIPVVIKLPASLSNQWVVFDQSTSEIKVRFEGPKNAISEINQKQKELTAIIEVKTRDLLAKGKDEINFLHKIKDMSFETEAGRVTEALKISMIDETEITYKIARTEVHPVFILNNDIYDAFENIPDENDYEMIINNIEPDIVHIKTPAIFKEVKGLAFEKISLANIKGRGIETREYTRKLRFQQISDDSTVQFYADKDLSKRIEFIDVTFGFNYKNISVKTFTDIPVTVILPPWCIENNITTDELPNKKIPRLNLRGRADALKELKDVDIELQLIVSETGIDKTSLIQDGAVTYISEYRLYVNSPINNSSGSAGTIQQTSQFEIVNPEFSLTGISIKLIKFK